MRDFVRNVFIVLVAIFLFIILQANSYLLNFLYINFFVNILLLSGAIVLVTWIAVQSDKWMAPIRFKIPIQVITSLSLMFFFIFQFFTPYFYSEESLREIGMEKIEMYYQLSNAEEFNDEEQLKLAETMMTKEMAFATITYDNNLNVELVEMEVIDLNRNYYQFELIAEILLRRQSEREISTYRYKFEKEGRGFKINGFTKLN